MALLEEWHKIAYNDKADQGELQRFWQHYFLLELSYSRSLVSPLYHQHIYQILKPK